MRRNDVLPASVRHLRTPAVIGSIALSFSMVPADGALAAEDRRATGATSLKTTLQPVPHTTEHDIDVVGAPASASAVRTYTVARGDTISAIAAAHGVRTSDVLTWNGLGWSSVIHPGDILRMGPQITKKDAAPAAPAPAATATYTVRGGDTLWSIAARHGLSVEALSRMNDLSSATIHPGQKLRVTALTAPRAAAATPAPPAATDTVHEVAAGQTLWSIADKKGISLGRLLAANGLTKDSIIYPGQKLRVPGPHETAAPAVARTGAAEVVLDAEQIANVKTIISVGRDRGVPRDGIAIALATAMVESWIRNLEGGDRDSLGLFQQRPSAGWGTEQQIRDPRRSAAAFFGGPADPNGDVTRGLLDIDGWDGMEFGAAAQAVQISAYPDRYGPWKDQAYRWLDIYG